MIESIRTMSEKQFKEVFEMMPKKASIKDFQDLSTKLSEMFILHIAEARAIVLVSCNAGKKGFKATLKSRIKELDDLKEAGRIKSEIELLEDTLKSLNSDINLNQGKLEDVEADLSEKTLNLDKAKRALKSIGGINDSPNEYLLTRDFILECLESGGVDNWANYEDSLPSDSQINNHLNELSGATP